MNDQPRKRVQIDLLPWMVVFGLSFYLPLIAAWFLIGVVSCNMILRVINQVKVNNGH